MKWLVRLNAVAAVIYVSFVAAILVADVWILPKVDALSAPPQAVGNAIRQGGDIEGMREIAMVLFDHVTEQAQTVNTLVETTVFWARLHFLLALGIACVNVALLLRLRRSLPQS